MLGNPGEEPHSLSPERLRGPTLDLWSQAGGRPSVGGRKASWERVAPLTTRVSQQVWEDLRISTFCLLTQ